MSVVAPDGVYDASPDGLGLYEGPAAIRGLIEDFWGVFEDLRSEVEEILNLGNGVLVAVVRHDGRLAAPLTSKRIRRTSSYSYEAWSCE
jgi:ketosteroid isomerase-like protein